MKGYIGIIRIYSIIDLLLFSLVIGANGFEIIGIVLLHIAFLSYLEYKHSHKYRQGVSVYISIILLIIGCYFFNHIEALGYVLMSLLYVNKNKKNGWFSPFARGLQNFFIAGAVIGYNNFLVYIILLIFIFRNLMGDFRDTIKDKKEGLKTIPIVFGYNKSIKNIHLLSLFLTTGIWSYLINLSIFYVLILFIIQLYTYNLTPR